VILIGGDIQQSSLPALTEKPISYLAERYDPQNHRLNAPRKKVFHYPGR
jgi:hypothetical protein